MKVFSKDEYQENDLMTETQDSIFFLPPARKTGYPSTLCCRKQPVWLAALFPLLRCSIRGTGWVCDSGAGWAGSAVPKPCPVRGGEIWLCVLAAPCRDKSPRRSSVRVSLWSLRSWGLLSWAIAYLVIRQFFSPRKALERVLFLTSARSPGTCPWLPQSMFSVFIKTYWSQESLWDWF